MFGFTPLIVRNLINTVLKVDISLIRYEGKVSIIKLRKIVH